MLLHALQRKKTMFVHVNYDWHMSHDDGSTDFSDDETLDDHPRANGLRTPEKVSPSDKLRTLNSGQTGNLSVFHSPNNNNSPDRKDYFANTSDWCRSTRILPDHAPTPTSSAQKTFTFFGFKLGFTHG